ncbi:MAG: hypothetical protein P8Y64_10100 [Gammaproteobacteria bacterium]|jgi:hypothetical protein
MSQHPSLTALTALVLAFGAFQPASAEILTLGKDQTPAVMTKADTPKRGMRMSEVVKKYGQPTRKLPPVGGASPQRPPITRWDYPGFTVYFENKYVVHTVINAPAQPAPPDATPAPAKPAAPMSPAEPKPAAPADGMDSSTPQTNSK